MVEVLWHVVLSGWYWFLVVTGTAPSHSPQWYNFWSGFGSDIAEFGLLFGAIHLARRMNCGVKGCWRFHRYEYDMEGVKHKVCRHHHPALGKDHVLTHDMLKEHYANAG